MSAFFVISQRSRSKAPAQACVNEFEDILINLLNARLVCPTIENKSANDFNTDDSERERIAFVICISEDGAYQSLVLIKNWRKIFDKVILYVFDAYHISKELGWVRKKLSRSIRALNDVDHIFTGVSAGVEILGRDFSAPVSFVPLAADVLRFGSGRSDRCISINAYGRQHMTHSKMLAEHFNDIEKSGSYLHTNHTEIRGLHDYILHRRQFWKLLSISKIAMAYDPMVVNRTTANTFSVSFIGQRWFESLAGGCLVVGARPTCSESKVYLDWDDATVELPKNDDAVIPFLEDLISDTERLANAHKRNYANSLLKNDWRHRLVDIFGQLKLDVPLAVQKEIGEMAAKANEVQKNN
jgi:hypothetical protein